MSTILNIETATRVCSVALAVDGEVVSLKESHEKNAHAENITLFSESVVQMVGLELHQLDAIAVSKGPGSYTGLRIGVSTAKGFCYSLDKPLIAINTLESLASGMARKHDQPNGYLFCPMIDARRMEVYAAVFDHELRVVKETEAVIIDEQSYTGLLEKYRIVFAGDGAEKCKDVLGNNSNAVFFDEILPSAAFLGQLAERRFKEGKFENVAYFEPFYLKDFVAGIPKVKGLM